MTLMGALLSVENLQIRFGNAQAVRGIAFDLEDGEVLGLVGESGSGKSATALAIMGLLGPAAAVGGSIRWRSSAGTPAGSIDLLQQSPAFLQRLRGKEIGMIFQEPMTALNPVMTIGRQIAECAEAHSPSLTRAEARRLAFESLERVAIPDAARRYSDYPHQFSGGQRQRILIAMAIINRPRLLIADEPTTALDVTVQDQILTLLAQLQRESGMSMLFISHDLAVVYRVASRIAVLRGGAILETGPAGGVLTQPRHEYTRSLLAAVPTLQTDRDQPLANVR